MKRKIIATSVLFVVFSLLSLYSANNIHYLLSGQRGKYTLNIIKAIQGLGVPNIRSFFFLFLCISVLFIGYMLVYQSYIKYKSDMQRITPDIETPKPEGQGQYGTARWLEKKKYDIAFSHVEISPMDGCIAELIKHGYDDLKAPETIQAQEEQLTENKGVEHIG